MSETLVEKLQMKIEDMIVDEMVQFGVTRDDVLGILSRILVDVAEDPNYGKVEDEDDVQ